MGMVFSAFVLGYALMQIPTGRLADRWGRESRWRPWSRCGACSPF